MKRLSQIDSEVSRFILIGVTAVAIDLIVYLALVSAGADSELAKAAGFVTGAISSYLGGRWFVFRTTAGSLGPLVFVALYGLSLTMNVAVNEAMLNLAGAHMAGLLTAWLVATVMSATLNFFGMKFAVFRG